MPHSCPNSFVISPFFRNMWIYNLRSVFTSYHHIYVQNNNNNCYIALYPVEIYEVAALYIINIKIYLTIKNIKKHKYYKCVHYYQHDKMPGWNMTIKRRRKRKDKKEEEKRSRSNVSAYINNKAFHTHWNKHKYYKCIHHYQHDHQKSTSTVMTINQKSTITVMTIRKALCIHQH